MSVVVFRKYVTFSDKVIHVVSNPSEGQHTILRTPRPYFQFAVRACQDVKIDLLKVVEDYEVAYTFHIGVSVLMEF